MTRNHPYCIEYKLHSADDIHKLIIIASSCEDAYEKAIDELYDEKLYPYSIWVSSVTYNNGKYKQFNNFEGKPY